MKKQTPKNKKIHFMGVGGSGLSAAALIAKKQGFEVSGCDLEEVTPYLTKVKDADIKVYHGHDVSHLLNNDLLVISPAIIFQNSNHAEYREAERRGMVQIWDEFLGKYVLPGKTSICIAGTHGKSTTTALAGLIFEKAGLDPSVLVGATVKEWKTNSRIGKSDIFILESDEFYEKFLSYKAQYAIINNIEFDHPDYFKTEKDVIETFGKFIKSIKGSKTLIVNMDSQGIRKLSKRFYDSWNSLNLYGYTLNKRPLFEIKNSLHGRIISQNETGTVFSVFSESLNFEEEFEILLPGTHNVYNAMGVIILARLFGIEVNTIKQELLKFKGVGRRMDLLGEVLGIKVYDDYAHHPTAIKATLSAVRQKFKSARVWAIVEPHSYSRTNILLKDYTDAFEDADKVIITPIFKARDNHDFGITGEAVVNVSTHKDIVYINSFEEVVKHIVNFAKKGDVVFVMGAGKSYQLAKDILEKLK